MGKVTVGLMISEAQVPDIMYRFHSDKLAVLLRRSRT